jgi:glycosyltransferase involved in cell wall biosynthesis
VKPAVAALPKISVVTPSFNQAPYLERNLDSVAAQAGVAVEHIVLDGGSTDASPDILRRHEGRLAYWRSAPDQGQTMALIEGFARASGDVLCWLNSDDYFWSPSVLAKVARAFAARPDADIVTADTVLVAPDETPLMIDMVARPSARRMRYAMAMPQQSTFWRRSAYQAVGGLDPSFRYCMDFDLFQRMSQGRTIVRLPLAAAAFRIHPESKTSTWQAVFREEMERLQGRYGAGALHWLTVKAVTVEIRLESIAAELAAILTGRRLPTYANARLEPVRWWVRRKWGLAG